MNCLQSRKSYDSNGLVFEKRTRCLNVGKLGVLGFKCRTPETRGKEGGASASRGLLVRLF